MFSDCNDFKLSTIYSNLKRKAILACKGNDDNKLFKIIKTTENLPYYIKLIDLIEYSCSEYHEYQPIISMSGKVTCGNELTYIDDVDDPFGIGKCGGYFSTTHFIGIEGRCSDIMANF
jgi:hypothetical protein